MSENSAKETPATTNKYGTQEASPRQDLFQQENYSNSQNIHHHSAQIVLDDTSFNRWVSKIELQSQVLFEAEAAKRQLKLLLSSLFPEFSEICHKALLNLFASDFKTLTKLVKDGHSNVDVILENLKVERSRRECRSGEKRQIKKTSTKPSFSTSQNRRTRKRKRFGKHIKKWVQMLNCQNLEICVESWNLRGP